MWHVAAGRAHRLGEDDVRRQFAAAAFEKLQCAAGVRRDDAAGEEPARLHHLVAGVVNRCRRVVTGADERELVGDLRVAGEDFGDVEIALGGDGLERPANLAGRVGLHVEEVELAGRAKVEDHDDRLLVRVGADLPGGLGGRVIGHGEAERAEGADLEEVAARDAVARGDGAGAGDF